MATAHSNEPSPTSSRQSDDFLNLFNRFGANVELWPAVESLGPSMVSSGSRGAEWDSGVYPGQLPFHKRIQFHTHGKRRSSWWTGSRTSCDPVCHRYLETLQGCFGSVEGGGWGCMHRARPRQRTIKNTEPPADSPSQRGDFC